MSETSMAAVREFLACRRIALAGVSRNTRDFSRGLMRELLRRGYDVVPVNPVAAEIEGRRCFRRLRDIDSPVDGLLVMTSAAAALELVRECHLLGISRVWLYRAVGPGSVSPEAVAYCKQHGLQVVAGECPYMFLPRPGWFHALHGWARRLVGSYPV